MDSNDKGAYRPWLPKPETHHAPRDSLRIPIAHAIAVPDPDPHRFHVHELPHSDVAQLATVARGLHAAEREARIGDHHVVDEDTPGFELANEPLLLGGIVRPRSEERRV